MINRGTEPFQLDMEYVLYVKAEDQNGRTGRRFQSTPEERLSIVGGKRPPQFYMPSYEVKIKKRNGLEHALVWLFLEGSAICNHNHNYQTLLQYSDINHHHHQIHHLRPNSSYVYICKWLMHYLQYYVGGRTLVPSFALFELSTFFRPRSQRARRKTPT